MAENDGTTDGGLVVVGVDDSPGSTAALVFALRDAARRGAALRVAAVYTPPDHSRTWAATSGGADVGRGDEFGAEVRDGVGRMLAEVREGLGDVPQPRRVEIVVAAGQPARTLLDLCSDADLLVVGSRGRGGFASMALGSVSMQCVLHAPCPVTVVRSGRTGSGAETAAAHPEPFTTSPAP